MPDSIDESKLSDPTLQDVLIALQSADSDVLSHTIGEITYNSTIAFTLPDTTIASLVDDPDLGVRLAILEYMEWHPVSGHTNYLVLKLSDNDPRVKWKAVRHLIRFPDSRAAPLLKDIYMQIEKVSLQDKDINYAIDVVDALNRCGDASDGHWLFGLLQSNFAPTRNRIGLNGSIGVAIAAQGNRTLIPSLIELMNSESVAVIVGVLAALAYFENTQAAAPLLRIYVHYKDDLLNIPSLAFFLVRALGNTGESVVIDTLIKLIPHMGAIDALAQFNEPRAINALVDSLADYRVRLEAAFALVKLGGKQYTDVLLNYFEKEKDDRVVGVFAELFGDLGDIKAIPVLKRKLQTGLARNKIQEAVEKLEK